MKAHITSLGCSKNLTDSEVLMGQLVSSGHEITLNPQEADMIIVNTCAFLKSAREEARDVIEEMAKIKRRGRGNASPVQKVKCSRRGTASSVSSKEQGSRVKGQKLYVAGCLPKYLKGEKVKWLKDIDGFIDSIKLYNCEAPRIKATFPWTAYVKIAEGCDNKCTYCLIPSIRGNLKTRPVEDILSEVKLLEKRGVKEVIFVAQDTTAHSRFSEILKKTSRLWGISWLRIMYTHPLHITDKLIDMIAKEKKILKYIDMPVQHASDKILKAMGRKYTKEFIEKLIAKLRKKIPDIVIRTSLITGFPGETEKDHEELFEFVRNNKFDRLGVFPYSREKGTRAGEMGSQIDEKVKRSRAKKLLALQQKISKEKNTKLIGKTLEVLVEKKAPNFYIGRSRMDAPDVDGKVYFKSKRKISPGDIIKVKITETKIYDLIGVSV